MTQSLPMTSGHLALSRTSGAHTYSSILSCRTPHDFLTAQIGEGRNPGRFVARVARHPEGRDIDMRASSILQTYLDDLGHAVMSERFEAYAARIELPLNILTSSASITVSTPAELENGFDEFCDMMRSLGVTDLIRTVKVARFIGNDHVVGIYETRMMGDRRQVLPTFHSKMWIGTYDDVWKAIKIHNTTKDARWPMLYTRLGAEAWPPEEI